MPELPEVETMRRGISSVVGCRIERLERPPCRKRPLTIEPAIAKWRVRVVGQTITETARLGKRVVLVLSSYDRIVFEPRMTGLVLLSAPPTEAHLRLRIELSGAGPSSLLYWDRRGLGSVRLFTAAEFEHLATAGKLGPDALAISVDEFGRRFASSRRAIKVALLDQRAVAGIGNLYASEILHLARIHPAVPCNRVTTEEWQHVHRAMRDILECAIRYEGSTLADGTYRNALNQAGGYQNQHQVYAKARQLCRQCGSGEIVRAVQAQRATFFCPVCQKPKRRSAKRPVARAR